VVDAEDSFFVEGAHGRCFSEARDVPASLAPRMPPPFASVKRDDLI
jgi:hypothetical protein